MPWWLPPAGEVWKWIAGLVCFGISGAWGLGSWLTRERQKRALSEQELRASISGAPSLKTQLDNLEVRVAGVEHRMDHATTHISDLGDDYQTLIGKVTVLESQIVEVDRARAWLFERVTELMTRRR
jgi:hypothetical protein